MDISGIAFSGFEIAEVQQLLRQFDAAQSIYEVVDGELIYTPKRLNSAFICGHLDCDEQRAGQLASELILGQFLDPVRLIPSTRGMALAYEKNLPRIPRVEAEGIVEDLLRAAVDANSRPGARVFVDSLDVFGSFVTGGSDLGDVDVLAVVVIPEDCVPEDIAERNYVHALLQVSDYVSITGEFDLVAAAAKKIRIFSRCQ